MCGQFHCSDRQFNSAAILSGPIPWPTSFDDDRIGNDIQQSLQGADRGVDYKITFGLQPFLQGIDMHHQAICFEAVEHDANLFYTALIKHVLDLGDPEISI